MAAVTWTAQARDDLEEACRYIARDSQTYAESLRTAILQSVDLLESSPRMGRRVPEYGREDVRELIVRRYRVMYRLRGEMVEILRVWHSARRFGRATLPDVDGTE